MRTVFKALLLFGVFYAVLVLVEALAIVGVAASIRYATHHGLLDGGGATATFLDMLWGRPGYETLLYIEVAVKQFAAMVLTSAWLARSSTEGSVADRIRRQLTVAGPPDLMSTWPLTVALGVLSTSILTFALSQWMLGINEQIGTTLDDVPWNAVIQSPGVLVGVYYIVVAPLVQELLFRGFAWNLLERARGPVFAWLVSSALFALTVMPFGERTLAVVHLALLLGALRLRYASLVPGMIAHALYFAVHHVVMVYPLLTPRPSLAVGITMQVLYLALIAWLYVGWKQQRVALVAEGPLPS